MLFSRVRSELLDNKLLVLHSKCATYLGFSCECRHGSESSLWADSVRIDAYNADSVLVMREQCLVARYIWEYGTWNMEYGVWD